MADSWIADDTHRRRAVLTDHNRAYPYVTDKGDALA
jgi:hypothetical protein